MKTKTISVIDDDLIKEMTTTAKRLAQAADAADIVNRLRGRLLDPKEHIADHQAAHIVQAYRGAQTWNAVHDREAFNRLADEIESWFDATVFVFSGEKPKIGFNDRLKESILQVRQWIE